MKVLVTGGADYVGNRCSIALMLQGDDVIVYDDLSVGNILDVEALGSLNTPGKLLAFVRGNLCDRAWLMDSLAEHDLDAILHIVSIQDAANTSGTCYADIISDILNILETMRIGNIGKLVVSYHIPQDCNDSPFHRGMMLSKKLVEDYGMMHGISYAFLEHVAGEYPDIKELSLMHAKTLHSL